MKADIESLECISKEIRRDVLRMTTNAGSGHPGGSLSAVDMITALYFHTMKHDAGNPAWPDRDRFILSKGHACPVLYACLARCGYFGSEELDSLRRIGSMLQGHPCMLTTPGIEISTGSLGQGLSVANGMALAGKLDGKAYRVYVLLGDGEVQEGQVWEAAMTSAHYGLDNITAIVDCNGFQIDGKVSDVMSISPLGDKFSAFGWHVIDIDGHDIGQITSAFEEAGSVRGKPTAIIARTIKGKGVSFMEHANEYHGKSLTHEELGNALEELA